VRDVLISLMVLAIVAAFVGIGWLCTSWMSPPPHVNTVPTVARQPWSTDPADFCDGPDCCCARGKEPARHRRTGGKAMRSAYEVLHRPHNDIQAADIAARFGSIEEARDFVGNPAPDDWREDQHRDLTPEADSERRLRWMIVERDDPESDAERVQLALQMVAADGQVDGDHHKAWVIDQVVRTLTGDGYNEWVRVYCDGEDGPATYSWDVGIAP